MKVIKIEYPTPIDDRSNDNIDAFVTLENGRSYTITVTTVDWICDNMKRRGKRYHGPGAPDLIVEELDHSVIESAVRDHAADDAYWLRVLSLSAGDDIPE